MSILIQSALGHATPILTVEDVMLGAAITTEEVEFERFEEEEEEEVELAEGVAVVVLTAF